MAAIRDQIKTLLDDGKVEDAEVKANTELASMGGKDAKSKVLINLAAAEVALAKMEVEYSLKVARDAWAAAKELGDKVVQSEVLICMVNGFIMKGAPKEALRAAKSSMAIVKESGKPELEARILHIMAAAHLKLQDADDGLEAEQKAMAIFKKTGDKQGEATSMTTIAKAFKILGQYGMALTTAREACEAWRALGRAAGVAAALDTIYDVKAAEGYHQEAVEVAMEELKKFQQAPNKKGEILLMEKVAQIAADCGQKTPALQTMEAAIKACKDAGDKAGEAQKTMQTAQMHMELSNAQDALRIAKDAEGLFSALGDSAGAEEARRLQTKICVKRGEYKQAPHRQEALSALKSFLRAVEQRELDAVKKYEIELDKASSAIQDTEMSTALESLFERDQGAIAFLEKQGWDLTSFKDPTLCFQFPHKAFYLQSIAGGMGFGPQFRSVHPWKKGLLADDEYTRRAMSVNQLPETESWQGVMMYRHGIIDGGIQGSGSMNNGP